MSDTLHRVKALAAAISDLPPVPRTKEPFTFWFRLQRRNLKSVLLLEAGQSLVRINPCYPELSEMHFDHASNVNMRYAKCSDIDAAYATALMGGEPYSDWN